MKVGRYYVSWTDDEGIEREDEQGNTVVCSGYYCQVYDDPEYENEVDNFCLAIGYEIPDDTEEALERGICEYLDVGIDELERQRKNERLIAVLEQYPSLASYVQELGNHAMDLAKRAVEVQLDGESRIRDEDMENICEHLQFGDSLFMQMLRERPEIEEIDISDKCECEYNIKIAKAFISHYATGKKILNCIRNRNHVCKAFALAK